jgi:hypothetical protein
LFLVDLSADPGEMTNLAAQHPERVRRLQQLHNEWLQDVGP